MNTYKIKKNSTSEIREKLKKSKFDLLTNENDFLVKTLKKAGQFPGSTIIIFFNRNLKFKISTTKYKNKFKFEDFKLVH